MSEELIGPLTAAQWCEFRMRGDDDLLRCCAVTSELRDAIFAVLHMGGDRHVGAMVLGEVWPAAVQHPLPDGRGGELLAQLHDYYLVAEVQP